MNNIYAYKESLISSFATISSRLDLERDLNYSTKFLEKWLNDIFNMLFNAQFIIDTKSNFAAIDNHDLNRGIAIQVTRTDSNQKIKSTICKFYKKDLHKKYNKLYFIILKTQREKFDINLDEFRASEKFTTLNKEWKENLFDHTKDIFDFKELVDKLTDNQTATLSQLNEICDNLKNITGHFEVEAHNYHHINNKGNSINALLAGCEVYDAIDKIENTFGPYKKIPIHTLLYIKIQDEDIGVEIRSNTLFTNNDIIIDEVKNNNSRLINFLLNNSIHEVRHFTKSKIGYSISRPVRDNCLICSIDNFKFLDGLPPDIDDLHTFNKNLAYLYNYQEIGSIPQAIDLYNKLFNYTINNKLWMHYAHLVYNFNKFFSHYLFKEDKLKYRNKLKERENEIDNDLWVTTMKHLNLMECKDVAEYYLNFNHIENYSHTLDLVSSYESVISDLNEGKSPNKIDTVFIEILRYTVSIFHHTSHNYIFHDLKYSNANRILERNLNMLFHLSSYLKDKHTLNNFDRFLLIILKASYFSKGLSSLLKKYYKCDFLTANMENIHILSNELLDNILTVNKKYSKKKTFSHYGTAKTKINDTIQNICTFLYSFNVFRCTDQ